MIISISIRMIEYVVVFVWMDMSHAQSAGKAGINRWLGWRPSVRGNAQDPLGALSMTSALAS